MATKASFSPGAGLAAISRVLSRASGTQADVETLKTIAIFCGLGLVVSLLLATNSLDMSAGFFDSSITSNGLQPCLRAKIIDDANHVLTASA